MLIQLNIFQIHIEFLLDWNRRCSEHLAFHLQLHASYLLADASGWRQASDNSEGATDRSLDDGGIRAASKMAIQIPFYRPRRRSGQRIGCVQASVTQFHRWPGEEVGLRLHNCHLLPSPRKETKRYHKTHPSLFFLLFTSPFSTSFPYANP